MDAHFYPEILPGQVIYSFKVEASRTDKGIARVEIPVTRKLAEDDVAGVWDWVFQDALETLRLLLRTGHPSWEMSTDKGLWRAEAVGFDDREDLWEDANRREWNLVPLKDALTIPWNL